MAFMKNDDHWAFLEDIEAPMWVDLNLEAKSNNQIIDDKWFNKSHQFHQCSSRQLKSAFSHSGEESTCLDVDLARPPSPTLPNSVSKSRGKQYRSKKWIGENQVFSFDKPHPVKALSRKLSCPGDKIRPKQSFIRLKETSTSKSSVVCQSSSSGKAISNYSRSLSTCGDPGSCSSSEANKADESNPTSTITSESGQPQQIKVMDVSSQAFGQTRDLLSVMKISLRKSRVSVMRQASRVEINNDAQPSKGRNSTSSKSSVGSSSNPRYNVRISTSTSVQPKETTPDSRNAGKVTNVVKRKLNSSGIVKASAIHVEEGTSNNRRGGGQPNIGKSTRQEGAKQKVPFRPAGAKILVPSRVNEQNSILAASKPKKKTAPVDTKNLAGDGNENVSVKTSASKKSQSKGVAGGVMVGRGQKGTKQSVSIKNGLVGMVSLKEKGKDRDNLEKPKNLIHRYHFR
ncbi:uncharacterized protein LOC133782600 [Humulus lupulus]|uniref:uncharacterized protein LOC133782600 n=1 Tax=Humulus lupulus TaxID=3486 RepID=UPI002B40FD69|nr:uncharacterized protein LOC133782600 [Humulus lupulus]